MEINTINYPIEYSKFKSMIYRTDPKTRNEKSIKNYVLKGITVCPTWKDSFKNFINDMGPCPQNYELDRIDNSKGYYKENCRWVPRQVNQYNRHQFKGGLKGTRFIKRLNKYSSQICIDYHTYYLGVFTSELEAHNVYRAIAKEWYGF